MVVQGEPISSVERMREGWEKTEYLLEPLIHTLPKKDQVYFRGIVRFLIGKDVAFANLKPHQVYPVHSMAENIMLFIYWIKLGGNMTEYINRRAGEYLNLLKSTMSENSMFLRYWTHSIQTVTQKLISEDARYNIGRTRVTTREEIPR